MNICLTANYSPWSTRFKGGGQLSTHRLAYQLAQSGHSIFVLYSGLQWIEAASIPDVPYTIVWAHHFRRRELNILSFARCEHAIARDEGLDIVHGNGDEAALLPYVCRLDRSRLVMTARMPQYPQLGLRGRWSHPRQAFTHLKENSSSYLLRYACRRADRVCVASRYALQMIKHALGVSHDRLCVVPNGVEERWFRTKRSLDVWAAPIVITFFGRLDVQKGIDVLISAFAGVVRAGYDMRLFLIGEGEERMGLWVQAQTLGLGDHVRFVPWMPPEGLLSHLEHSALCVLPSRSESFGNTIAEAMAAGVPVISTRAGAIPEILVHGQTGLLTAPDDRNGLRDALVYALEHPDNMENMASAARERIRALFTMEHTAMGYLNVYTSLK